MGTLAIFTIIDSILYIGQHLVRPLAQYGPWTYAILFAVIFCETGSVVTSFLPGDSLLFVAGDIAAIGDVNIHATVLLLLAAAILGDAANFMVGRYLGQKLFANPDSKIFRRLYLEETHAFYEKHGGRTIIVAHFILIVRTFTPFITGMDDMHYATFIRYNAIGTVLWVLLFSYVGYLFANILVVKNNLGLVMAATIVISILPTVVEIIRAEFNAKK